MSKRKQVNFRCGDEDLKRLKYICDKAGINATKAIKKSIAYTYQGLKEVTEPEQVEQLAEASKVWL